MRNFFAILLLVVVAPCPAFAGNFIWWEGEKPIETNFPPKSPFAVSTFADRANLLSDGDWLSAGGKRGKDVLFARYVIDVPRGGDYTLWVRKFWAHGPFRWRFDQTDWRVCDRTFALADDTPLRKFVNANWVCLGKVTLPGGTHPFELQLLANEGEETVAAFDCFCLSDGPFIPTGKLKPGERGGRADDDYFAWEPSADSFAADCPLDLRNLNEPIAGQHGFLRREGDRILLGDRTPARFWAVNVSFNNAGQDHGSVDYLARKLAKLGVNMVRFHGGMFDRDDPTRLNARQLDDLFYLESAMKQQGIYTCISFYFPLWIDAGNPKLGLEGYDKLQNKKPLSLLFFDPRMQEIYRGWAKQLLDTKNPYTGVTLAQDPGVGMVEIVNEDSLFFWTFKHQNVPDAKWRELENQYSLWLARRFGSVQKALDGWGGTGLPQDDTDHAGLYEAIGMTDGGARRWGQKRLGDQARFLAETQRNFYADTAKFFHEQLHFGGLVNTSNWIVSDPFTLAAIEHWTYLAGDVSDTHGYFAVPAEGDGSDHSVQAGHTFQSIAAVLHPDWTPLRFRQTADTPQIVSEINWNNPNRYRCDAPFLASAYGALQGAKGVFFFAVGSNYMRDTSLNKFNVASAVVGGSFPAAALMFRRGDVKTGSPAVYQVLNPEDLFAMKGSATWSRDALDDFRQKDVPANGVVNGTAARIDDFAPFVGPVVWRFGTDVEHSYQQNLPRYIDRTQRVIHSDTGELRWDYGNGVVRLDTPNAQGATGFLNKAGAVTLGDLTIECSNDYAAIIVISLDDRPLATSHKIMVQAVTQEQPVGFRTEPAVIKGQPAEKIIDLGAAPFEVRRVHASITFKNSAAFTVTSLDENGYARAKPPATKPVPVAGKIELAEDAIYQIISR